MLTPLSPNQVQIWAKKTGITRVTLWDDRQESHSIGVSVNGDCQELAAILRAQFPYVYDSGTVDQGIGGPFRPR